MLYIYNYIYIYTYTVWWFGTFFYFPYIYIYIWKNNPNWLKFFQRGWNHQPVYIYTYVCVFETYQTQPYILWFIYNYYIFVFFFTLFFNIYTWNLDRTFPPRRASHEIPMCWWLNHHPWPQVLQVLPGILGTGAPVSLAVPLVGRG